MIDFKKVFVDTAPFIYFIEGDNYNLQYHEKALCLYSLHILTG